MKRKPFILAALLSLPVVAAAQDTATWAVETLRTTGSCPTSPT